METNLHVLRKRLGEFREDYGASSTPEIKRLKRKIHKLEKRRTQKRKGKHPLSPHGRHDGVGKSRRVRKSKVR